MAVPELAQASQEFDLQKFQADFRPGYDDLDLHEKERVLIDQLYHGCRQKGWQEEDLMQLHIAVRLLHTTIKGLRRDNGDPTSSHALEVALIVLNEMRGTPTGVISALIHDVPEDTRKRGTNIVTFDHIGVLFGQDMKRRVFGLTKVKSPFNDRDRIWQTLLNSYDEFKEDPHVIEVKLADRLHNMRTLGVKTPEDQRRIARWTMDTYVPLAKTFGYHKIGKELSYWSAYYLMPEKRQEIAFWKPGRKPRKTRKDPELAALARDINGKFFMDGYDARLHYPDLHDLYVQSGGDTEKMLAFRIMPTVVLRIDDNTGREDWIRKAQKYIALLSEKSTINSWQLTDLQNAISLVGPGVQSELTLGNKRLRIRFIDENFVRYYQANIADYFDPSSPLHDPAQDKVLRFQENFRRIRETRSVYSSAREFAELLRGNAIVVYDEQGKPYGLPEGASALDAAFTFKSHLGKYVTGVVITREGAVTNALSERLRHGDVLVFTRNDDAKIAVRPYWINYVKTPTAIQELRSHYREKIRQERRRNLPLTSRELTKAFYDIGIEKIKTAYWKIAQLKSGEPRSLAIENSYLDKYLLRFMIAGENSGNRPFVKFLYPTTGSRAKQITANFYISIGLRDVEMDEYRQSPVWQFAEYLYDSIPAEQS